MDPTPFFAYARERQAILNRRRDGEKRPWTKDAILDNYKFCNIYREDDATTVWFRENVRDRLRSVPEVLLATVVFRWFNRTTTGDAIFRQIGDYTPDGKGGVMTAFEWFLGHEDPEVLGYAVRRFCGEGPYVTGAYIIKSPHGMNKLDGLLQCIGRFVKDKTTATEGVLSGLKPFGWRWMAETLLADPGHTTLECVWSWLRRFDHLGDFMAYEIVTDLRHTDLLCRAPDIYTWANPGPGAMRGLNRMHGRDLDKKVPRHVFVTEMRQLLDLANTSYQHVWPHRVGFDVEMRDIEHTLCEFDKYERTRLNQGRPRGRY